MVTRRSKVLKPLWLAAGLLTLATRAAAFEPLPISRPTPVAGQLHEAMAGAAALDQWLVAEQLASVVVSMTARGDSKSHALAQYNLALARWRLGQVEAPAQLEAALMSIEAALPGDAPGLVEPLLLTSIAVRKRLGPARARYYGAEYAIAREKAKRALRIAGNAYGRNSVRYIDLELKVAVEWPSGTDRFRAVHYRAKKLRKTPEGAALSARATHFYAVSRIRDGRLTGVPELLREVLGILDRLQTDDVELRMAVHKRLVQTMTALGDDNAATVHTLEYARLAATHGRPLPAVLIESDARTRNWQPINPPVVAQIDVDAEGRVKAFEFDDQGGAPSSQSDEVRAQADAMRFAPLIENGKRVATRVRVAIYDDTNRMVDPDLRCRTVLGSATTNDRIALVCMQQPAKP